MALFFLEQEHWQKSRSTNVGEIDHRPQTEILFFCNESIFVGCFEPVLGSEKQTDTDFNDS